MIRPPGHVPTFCLGPFEAYSDPPGRPQACHSAQSPVRLAHRCICYGLISIFLKCERSCDGLALVDLKKKHPWKKMGDSIHRTRPFRIFRVHLGAQEPLPVRERPIFDDFTTILRFLALCSVSGVTAHGHCTGPKKPKTAKNVLLRRFWGILTIPEQIPTNEKNSIFLPMSTHRSALRLRISP